MDNVIAFPRPAASQPARAERRRSMTLFLHVKCTTMIVHLANCDAAAYDAERVAES